MAMSHFHSVGYETATSILRRARRFSPVDLHCFILDLTVTKRQMDRQ